MTNLEIFLLGFLGILSISTGFYFRDVFTGFGSNYFNNSIYNLPSSWSLIDLEFIPAIIKLMPLIISVVALIIALKLNGLSNSLIYVYQIKTFFESCKWFYNEVLNNYIALPVLKSGRYVFDQYEKNIIEKYGPMFIVSSIRKLIY